MTVFLWDHKLTYVSVPKVACTSLKNAFFEIENGFRFKRFRANGQPKHIHNTVYPSRLYSEIPHGRITGHTRLTVVRDPVKRLLSCYSNRVVFFGELSSKHISDEFQEMGATPDPSIEEFVEKLGLYRDASRAIWRHSNPLADFLGNDSSYYHGVYSIEDLDAFRVRVEQIVGHDLQIRHLQTGGPKISPDELSPNTLRKIRKIYEEDYDIYGRFF